MSLRKLLIREEGMRKLPYEDSLGIWTVGVGHKMSNPLSNAAIMQILDDDIAVATEGVERKLPWVTILNQARNAVLVSMAFQMGISGLLNFKKFLVACEQQDWITAADEMINSRWARQTPERVARMASQIISGKWV